MVLTAANAGFEEILGYETAYLAFDEVHNCPLNLKI